MNAVAIDQSESWEKRVSWLAFTLVLAVSVVAGWVVYVNLVLRDAQPFWDEAAHSLRGALIAHDVRQHDLLGFLFDSYRQVYWPPLNSWLLGIAFLLTGPSIEAARVVSVVAFVLLAPTLFLVAVAVEPRYGVLAGCLAAGLSLTSPGLIDLAARNMLELPGLLALSGTMLVYCVLQGRPRGDPRAHMLVGVGIVVTYLTKTSYGILLVIGIALTELIAVRFRPRPLLTRANLYAVLPLAAFCVIWFAYPPKIVSTWNALVNRPYGGEEARGIAGLLFYPRLHIALSGSWWMSLLLCGGLGMAWMTRGKPGIRFLAIVALTLFVIGEFHHTKVYRHIMPTFPPMFVLTGMAGARLWAWVRDRGAIYRAATVALLICIGVFHAPALGRHDWRASETREGVELIEYVFAEARGNGPSLVLGTRGAWPEPPVIDWNLVSEGFMPVTAAGAAMDPRQELRLAKAIGDHRIPEGLRATTQRLLTRYNAPSMIRSIHAGDRSPDEDAAQFEGVLESVLGCCPTRTIITMVGISDTTSQTHDFIAPGIVRNGFRQTSVREFPRARTRVYVYRRHIVSLHPDAVSLEKRQQPACEEIETHGQE